MSAEALPLARLRVAVTRPEEDAGEMETLLRRAGAAVVLLPLTRTLRPEDEAPLRRALAHLRRYDWIVFTSPRAVRATGIAGPWAAARVRIAAVGPSTASAIRSLTGRDPDAVPKRYAGDAIVPAMLEHGSLRGSAVLWPRAEQARPELREALAEAGAVLDDPVAYRTAADLKAGEKMAALAAAGELDAITFAAPSAVDCFADAGGTVPAGCTIAVIGPATAAAARARGLPVHVEPQQPIISALVAALARYYDRRSAQQQ
jgi:uroporphyrinogen-III synthase